MNDDPIIDSGELQTMIVYGECNYKCCQGEESSYYACGVGPFYFGPGADLSSVAFPNGESRGFLVAPPVPEPAEWVLLAGGLASLLWIGRGRHY